MYVFNVSKSGNKLLITTNTFWSCNVYGNFRLSKYSGNGSEEITIEIPKELPNVNGEVIFSYGDDRCKYPSIDVFLLNDCYIQTEPMYTECPDTDGTIKKIIKILFNENKEAISIKVHSNGIWSANGEITHYKNNDVLLIEASEGILSILPNPTCANEDKVYIELEKKRSS